MREVILTMLILLAISFTGDASYSLVKTAHQMIISPSEVPMVLAASDIWLLPQPKEVWINKDKFDLKKCRGIRLFGCESPRLSRLFPTLIEERSAVKLKVSRGDPKPGYISLVLCPYYIPPKSVKCVKEDDLKGLGEQGYFLSVDKDGVTIAASTETGLYYGTRTLAQIATDRSMLPGVVIRDCPALKYRGAHDDISRGQVPTQDTFKRLTRVLAEGKGNLLELYIEHLFKWKKYPDIAPMEAISPEEARELFDYAAEYGIEVHPMLQVLGHSYGILRLPQYQRFRISEVKTQPWMMTFDIRKPETVAFINDLVKEICEAFPGKFLTVDITEIDIEGLNASGTTTEQATEIVYQYVLKLRDMIKPYGMRLMIAQGPLDSVGSLAGFGPVISKLPKDIMIASYYTVSPGAYGTAWELDFPRFRKYGIDFFAQPWINSHIRIMPDTVNAADQSDAHAIKGVGFGEIGSTTTDWGDDGHYHFTGQTWYPYLYHCASAWAGGRLDRDYFNQAFTRLIYGVKDDSIARAINLVGSINSQKIKFRNEKKEVYEGISYHYWEFWQDPFTHPDLTKIADPAATAADILKSADEAASLLDAAGKQATRNKDNLEQLIFGVRGFQAMGAKLRMLADYRTESVPRKQVVEELNSLVKTYEDMKTDFQRMWLAEDRENDGYRELVARFGNTIIPCKQKAEELTEQLSTKKTDP